MQAQIVSRSALGAALVLALASTLAQAGPAEDAQAAFSKFFPAFVSRNQATVAAMFAPGAQFYGTLSPTLVTDPQGVMQYFTTALDRPEKTEAIPLTLTATALTDSIVLLAGTWRVDRTVDDKLTQGGPLRMTAVMQKRDGQWTVVQFHNSQRPAPSAPPPQSAASR
jgi:hypothetical protein